MPVIAIKLNKEIDYGHVITAYKLDANPQLVEISKQLFKSTIKALEDNRENENRIITDMFSRWQFSIFQNTIVVHVTNWLETHFDAEYDNAEIENIANGIITKNTKAKKEDVIQFVKRNEFQQAIWEYLANEWKVEVTDDEVNKFLDDYYTHTNNSIRELKQDPAKFAKVKKDIRLHKVMDALSKRFIVKLEMNLTI